MPPHLRHGIPVEQRLPPKSQPLHLCTCWQCYAQTAIDPVTLEVQQGVYVPWNVYLQHIDNEKTRGIAPPQTLNTARAPVEAGFPVEQSSPYTSKTTLEHTIEDIRKRLPNMRQSIIRRQLVFVRPPTTASLPLAFRGFDPCDTAELNSGTYALDYSAPENHELLAWEEWLTESLQYAERGKQSSDVTLRLKSAVAWKEVTDALEEVDDIRAGEWERQRVLLSTGVSDHESSQKSPPTALNLHQMEPFVAISLVLVATAHLLCHLSIDHCSFILTCLRETIVATAKAAIPTASSFDPMSLSKPIPSDVRTVIDRLYLTPVTRPFVCCPKCFTCYPITEDMPHPDHCNHQETPSSPPCNHLLRKTKNVKGQQKSFPVRRFLVHSLEDWVSKLLNQPELEGYMDEYPTAREASENIHDIWDAKALQDLKGPDGEPFTIKCGKEGRYVFSICMDGLNYDGNRHGGRKASVCAIYMVCLNLPPQLRYKFQNLFLAAVIPGPNEPSLHQINHVLAPLVDDLLRLYNDGATIQTPNHPEGRLVRIALGPLVSDLIAARQMAGFSSHSSTTFCPHCSLTLGEISNTDKSTWGVRDVDLINIQARAWRDAESEKVRNELWEANGVRWTELRRLPYWDPSKFTTIDPMHLLYLGNLQRHCRKVWGMDEKFADGVGITHDQLRGQSHIDKGSPEAAMDAVNFGTDSEVASFHESALKKLCGRLGLQFGGRKKALLKALMEFRAGKGWPAARVLLPATALTPEDVNRGLWLLENAQHSRELNLLNKQVLVELCSRKLKPQGVNYDVADVSSLVESLSDWRIDHGIADKNGGLVSTTTQYDPIHALWLFDNGGEICLMKKPELVTIAKDRLVGVSAQECERMEEITLRKKLESLRAQQRVQSLVDKNKEDIAAAEIIIMSPSSSSKDLQTLKRDAILAFLLSRYEPSHQEKLDGMSKQELMEELKGWRRENYVALDKRKTRVLGRKVLGELWSDMGKTHLPSSVTPLPKNVGSAQAGSLGADEWRILCLIHLTITLTRLWGNDVQSRGFRMLENFMNLVAAVKLASMRTTCTNRIQSYEFYMQSYLSELLVLYPGATVTPNHHLSLHLPEILDRFGPSHVFRAFVFERGNLILQRTPTNNKMDELSPTLMTRFCQKQRLKALFDGFGSSDALSSVVQKFNHVFNSDLRGTVNEFISGSDQSPSFRDLQRQMTPLSDEISLLLGVWRQSTTSHVQATFMRAAFLPVSTIRDCRVTTWRTSLGDSHVAFHEQDGTWSAGRVREIFVHVWHEEEGLKGKVFLVVDVFSKISAGSAPNDPYRKFPVVGGRMFLERFSELRVISDEEFWCQFARYDQTLPGTSIHCITAIPLDKE